MKRAPDVADALATTTIVRYALSFDGLATKANHHQTVSEYFTPVLDADRQADQPIEAAALQVGAGVKYSDTVWWWLTLVARPSNDSA